MHLSRRDFVRTLFVASQATLASRLLSGNLHASAPSAKSLNFAVIGDWGRRGQPDQAQVATQMGIACKKVAASFVISVGDNFYEHGVTSIDDSLWHESFENVYTADSLQVPWYSILGNHDYHGNCDAQVAYGKTHPRWNMPARYYSQLHPIDASTNVEFFYLDTCPFVKAYQHDSRYSDIATQDSAVQLQWLEKGLAASTAHWKLVMGHHPVYSSGLVHGNQPEIIAHVLPLLQKYKVQAYFAGHDHDLEHLKVGNLDLIVSGAGSENRPVKAPATSPFSGAVSGFVMASLSASNLQLQFIDNNGKLLYTANIPRIG